MHELYRLVLEVSLRANATIAMTPVIETEVGGVLLLLMLFLAASLFSAVLCAKLFFLSLAP